VESTNIDFSFAEELPAYQESLCFLGLHITLIRHVCDFPFYLCLSTYLAPKKRRASRKHADTNTEDSGS